MDKIHLNRIINLLIASDKSAKNKQKEKIRMSKINAQSNETEYLQKLEYLVANGKAGELKKLKEERNGQNQRNG